METGVSLHIWEQAMKRPIYGHHDNFNCLSKQNSDVKLIVFKEVKADINPREWSPMPCPISFTPTSDTYDPYKDNLHKFQASVQYNSKFSHSVACKTGNQAISAIQSLDNTTSTSIPGGKLTRIPNTNIKIFEAPYLKTMGFMDEAYIPLPEPFLIQYSEVESKCLDLLAIQPNTD